LTDVAVLSEKAKKKLKYKNLCIEIQCNWNMKCFVIPVSIGGMGTVGKI
jgi:hypothetical protein